MDREIQSPQFNKRQPYFFVSQKIPALLLSIKIFVNYPLTFLNKNKVLFSSEKTKAVFGFCFFACGNPSVKGLK